MFLFVRTVAALHPYVFFGFLLPSSVVRLFSRNLDGRMDGPTRSGHDAQHKPPPPPRSLFPPLFHPTGSHPPPSCIPSPDPSRGPPLTMCRGTPRLPSQNHTATHLPSQPALRPTEQDHLPPPPPPASLDHHHHHRSLLPELNS